MRGEKCIEKLQQVVVAKNTYYPRKEFDVHVFQEYEIGAREVNGFLLH